MTDYLVLPPARRVHGTVRAPSSKSATNRALLLAALSPEPVEIVRPLDCHDTRVLARCLEAMGAVIEPAESGLFVRGPLGRLSDREIVLDAGSSGTAARFLAALAAAVPGTYLLTGSPRLTARPMSELAAALVSAGASVRFEGRDGHLPLRIRGGSLRPGAVSVDASRSSQFLSALLLAGAAVEGGLAVRADGPVASAPYVEMTIETLEEFGHDVRERDGAIEVRQGTRPAVRYETPGDYSSAMPLLAAAGILGGEVVVTGLRHPSRDADALALGALEAMGVAIERDAGGPGRARSGRDRGRRVPRLNPSSRRPGGVRGGGELLSRDRAPAVERERPHRVARRARRRRRGNRGGGRGGALRRRPSARRRRRDPPASDLRGPPHRDGGWPPLPCRAGRARREPGLRRQVVPGLLSRSRDNSSTWIARRFRAAPPGESLRTFSARSATP